MFCRPAMTAIQKLADLVASEAAGFEPLSGWMFRSRAGSDVVPSGLNDKEEGIGGGASILRVCTFPGVYTSLGVHTPSFTISPLQGSADGVGGIISWRRLPTQGGCPGLICSCPFGAGESIAIPQDLRSSAGLHINRRDHPVFPGGFDV